MIRKDIRKIEIFWALMHLSLLDYLTIGQEIESPLYYASQIKDIDDFYGYLAWSEVFIRSQTDSNQVRSESILKELIQIYPSRPESYIKLWYYYYASKAYSAALEVAEMAFLKLAGSSEEYTVILNLNYAKSLYKMEKFQSAFELLQMMYTQNSQYSVYLYHYGRLCLKSRDKECLGSAVGALEECLKTSSEGRHGNISYWLMVGYSAGNDKFQAYTFAKKGIKHFSSVIGKFSSHCIFNKALEKKVMGKMNEMKNLVKDMHIGVLNMEMLESILENFEINKLEEVKIHCKNIAKFDQIEGNILKARVLLAIGDDASAIKLLRETMSLGSLKMKAFFLLVKVLSQYSDTCEIEKLCKEMMGKCRNSKVPVQIWIKTHIIYTKCLVSNGEYQKAILVLKSLAQVQPPPFIPDLKYTKRLQMATDKLQLLHVADSLQYDANPCEDDIQTIINSRTRLLGSKRNLSSIVIESDSENEVVPVNSFDNEEIKSESPSKSKNSKLSFTDTNVAGVSYKFLYFIGKISAKYEVCIEDGFHAMHDFLNIHHYWMKEGIEIDEKIKVKGQFWLAVLFYLRKNYESAIQIFNEIYSMIFELSLEKMIIITKRYLQENKARLELNTP